MEVQAAGTLVEVEDAARREMGIISVQRYVPEGGWGIEWVYIVSWLWSAGN